MPKPLLTIKNIVTSPIAEGDAGIILKPDGTFKVFSTGDIGGELTEQQKAQGQKLVALAMALSIDMVMDTLLEMSSDPEIVSQIVAVPLNG